MYEAIGLARPGGDLGGGWLFSIFSDGRWSTQGDLVGTRSSPPVSLSPRWRPLFANVRGEVALNGGASAQQGLMPTMQLQASTRLRFESLPGTRRMNLGAAVARGFDGFNWRTTVMGEGSGTVFVGQGEYRLTFTPMQLSGGDVMADWEGGAAFPLGRLSVDASLGVRLGEAQRGTTGWGAFTVVVPWRDNLITTISIGSYPADLVQGLPGGRYAAVNMRLPRGRLFFGAHKPVVVRQPPPPEYHPPLPVTDRLALTMGAAYDSLGLREVRVWAPGIGKVELVADFTQWIAVPLIRVAAGEWHGYYQVLPGSHRLNLLLDGVDLDVPENLVRVNDDFNGATGLIVVR